MERYYTIEDIEILRSKSGISYEEAVNLLEYHNGNLAKALVDLEKNGKIGQKNRTQAQEGSNPYDTVYQNQNNAKKVNNIFTKLYRFRIIVHKKNMTIANVSLLYLIPVTLFAFWVVIPSILLVLLLGYQISVDKDSPDFAKDNFEDMVKTGARTVKKTVIKFTSDDEQPKSNPGNQGQADENSYYNRQNTQAPPTNASPVTVEYQDEGSYTVSENEDGSQEATIQ